MGTYSRNTGGGSGAFQGHRLRGRPAGKAQRSAGTGGHGHRETRRNGAGRGAGLRRNANGARAAERRGGQRSRGRRRQRSYRRGGAGPRVTGCGAGRAVAAPAFPPQTRLPAGLAALPPAPCRRRRRRCLAAPDPPTWRRPPGQVRAALCGRFPRAPSAALSGTRVRRSLRRRSAFRSGVFCFEPPVREWQGMAP